MGRFTGRVAYITGAARGQGRAEAVRLAEEGADVVVSDICAPVSTNGVAAATPGDLDETARLAEKTGQRVIARRIDVRDLAAMESLAAEAVAELGHIDIVVANAGILSWGNAWELSSESWNELIDVNLTGVFHTIRATVPHMIRQGSGGSIILTSSAAGLKGQPFTLAYTAAKHGVVGICRGLANELGAYDIRVNSIHPAAVATEMMHVPGLFSMIKSTRRR
jgi:SDR family mycofactocin-dependent oxidoreductase